MHTRNELEVHLIEKGCLSCNSDTPQVGSARSDTTRVVKVNRRKTNRCKRDPTVLALALNILRFNQHTPPYGTTVP